MHIEERHRSALLALAKERGDREMTTYAISLPLMVAGGEEAVCEVREDEVVVGDVCCGDAGKMQ